MRFESIELLAKIQKNEIEISVEPYPLQCRTIIDGIHLYITLPFFSPYTKEFSKYNFIYGSSIQTRQLKEKYKLDHQEEEKIVFHEIINIIISRMEEHNLLEKLKDREQIFYVWTIPERTNADD